jgi:ring-1,2-phenylacetyl-CoA epoxidase subunit PaaD
MTAADPVGDGTRPSLGALWQVLDTVPDPEIPAVSVVELGILRGVEWDAADPLLLVVTVTPTYSGCPATELIMTSIREAVAAIGVTSVRIETRLAPAWTTDWMTAEARRKLRDFGIAPPGGAPAPSAIDVAGISPLRRVGAAVACPRCGRRRNISQFGSTACKAPPPPCVPEPFDYFKPH